MKYMGSKNRIAKYILPIMLEEARKSNITKWVEPFVGGGNLIDKVPASFIRLGYDVNPHCIAALLDIRDIPNQLPDTVSLEEYKSHYGKPASSISSYIRFVGSFGGKFENGYAREAGSDSSTFFGYGKRNALKQSPALQGVQLTCSDFSTLTFEDSLIYCDPPYKGTTSYKTLPFDYELFYNWCLSMKDKGNIVFISEYNTPFTEVWAGEIKTNFASTRVKATHNAVEKLFKV